MQVVQVRVVVMVLSLSLDQEYLLDLVVEEEHIQVIMEKMVSQVLLVVMVVLVVVLNMVLIQQELPDLMEMRVEPPTQAKAVVVVAKAVVGGGTTEGRRTCGTCLRACVGPPARHY